MRAAKGLIELGPAFGLRDVLEQGEDRADVFQVLGMLALKNSGELVANIDQSVHAFQQIVAGTNQQQIGFENVMQALKDMSRASEQAAASTKQTEKSAANLTDLSAQLRMATEGYRI